MWTMWPSQLYQSPQGPPVWVPSIVFVNTPNTDLSLTDNKASLNVRKLGQYSVSPLDNVEQVRAPNVISLDLIVITRSCSMRDLKILSTTRGNTPRTSPVISSSTIIPSTARSVR